VPPVDHHEANTLKTLLQGLAAVPRLEAKVAALEAELVALRIERQRARVRQKWLTLEETSKVLRYSEKTVMRRVNAGRLRRNLESWRVLILAEDVESYSAQVTVAASAPLKNFGLAA